MTDPPEKKKMALAINHDAERYALSVFYRSPEESKKSIKSKVLARLRRSGE